MGIVRRRKNGNDDYKPDRVQGCEYQGRDNLRARLDGPQSLNSSV